ncbi:ROK family protein [Caproiciproducens sp. NJN-50]|uniref:ROK family protein n=1 Tax=Acutalibacteraceae TaxID=3082771 RepID=UPI000FFDFE27|nr:MULTISPECIES: ROK family protein [Acutalibacteraceae]QAT50278.1 ROK family protein [Caproiciproducens sp. NJN-50]
MYYLGIDLGGTNIATGVVDQRYRIVARAKRKTSVPCKPLEICEQLAATVQEALGAAGLSVDDIPYVGVGTPGTVNRDSGVVEYSNNLFFENLELRKLLSDRLKKDVILENDANAAAFGEFRAGALKGARNAVAITLGTGIGSGIIIDGKIYAGSNFAGGEIGHTVIVAGGKLCTCGRRGCWEAYASATGLVAMTREAMRKDKSSLLWKIAGDPDQVDGRSAFEAVRAGDETGKKVVDQYLFYLSCGVANCINVFQPDILCIGGGISNEGEFLMEPLRKAVAAENYARNAERQTVLCKAQLGNDAGILGAALLGTEC